MKRILILIHHVILPAVALIEMPSAMLTMTVTMKLTATVIREVTKMKMLMLLMDPPSMPTLTSRRESVSITSLDTLRFTNLPTFTVRKVYPEVVAAEIEQPEFHNLIRQFIYDQQHPDNISNASISDLPMFYEKVSIYSSAIATFHAPSDISGIGGMRRERIRAVKSWRNGPGRYDTIFVNTDPSMDGVRGLDVARVQLFFSFSHDGVEYPCALVRWFSRVGDSPDIRTGMWVVQPDDDESPPSIIHLDSVVRAAHLLPVFGPERVSRTLSFTDTLDKFTRFYINKFADHHSFEIVF